MSEDQSEARTSPPREAGEWRPLRVVAIGASAGGLESLERFFGGITSSVDAAFVVIQHLSPNYETMMDHLLSRHTFMPVSIAANGEPCRPNQVYVIPPKKDMTLSDGRLVLSDQSPDEMPHLPIDRFFQSMAEQFGNECAAVVLSGTGSDGSRGARAVRQAGGLVFCETEATAKFTGMPRSANATGCVDYVLPPESIAGMLVRGENEDDAGFADANNLRSRGALREILLLLRGECQIDFSHYKSSTVSRRIDRRMRLRGVTSLDEYTTVLRNDIRELRALYQDMLIGVTRFFRDPPCFEYLAQQVIPEIVKQASPENGPRVWVAGCASGEEAYSVAILFDEHYRSLGAEPTFKIFATDVHPLSLRRASVGSYLGDALTNVSAERLRTYFTQQVDGYLINPSLRQRITFAPHNLLRDPPFTDLDLVTCRNLLIYFDAAAQKRALTLFHFGLRKEGVLFLGPSETVGTLGNDFLALDERCKVFSKRHEARLPEDIRLPIPPRALIGAPPLSLVGQQRVERIARMRTYDRLLDALMPPTLLVDGERRVVECFGGAEKWLRFPPRAVSHDLLVVCPPELRTPLSVLFRRVKQERQEAKLTVFNAPVDDEDAGESELVISPLPEQAGEPEYYAIRLRAIPASMDWESRDPNADRQHNRESANAVEDGGERELAMRILDLEDELKHTKENLQATIEELEASNEELQATNEELISSNEELQSTNEELNSVNEELHTVNVEYQSKNSELRELYRDMNHLFASTDIGTIFLDEHLAIRRFTPRVADIFDLRASDVGRELSTFTHTLTVGDLHGMTAATLRDGQIRETEADDNAGRHYFVRVVPYRIEDETRGVIVTLTDITSLTEAKNLARSYQNRLQETIDTVPVFVAYVNRHQCYEYANRAYSKWLGKPAEEIIGRSIADVVGSETYQRSRPYIEAALAGEPQSFDAVLPTIKGELSLNVHYIPTHGHNGEVLGFHVAGNDITQLKRAQRELAEAVLAAEKANNAKSDFLAKMSHEIRSPMTSIIGFADILDQQLKQPDNRDCVQIIRNNAYHLLSLINDILDLSRVEAGYLELDITRFSPADLARECYNSTLPRATSGKVELRLAIRVDSDLGFSGDRRRLRQVLMNLLSNAIKFSAGEAVDLAVARIDGELSISVQDQGCGIAAEDLKTLFDPFWQADNTDSRKFEGSGLGLTIAKQLVERMGGRLTVKSQPKQGSLFQVVFPWEDDTRLETGTGSDIQIRDSLPRLDGRVVLVVDDRRDIRFIAEHILADVGADVMTAENGYQAIEIVRRRMDEVDSKGRQVDCVVTDIQMPEMDGFETTRRLRALGYRRPILALTASAMARERDECLQAGCDGHFAKPINRSDFINTIARMIKEHDVN